MGEATVEQVDEAGGASCEGPFEEFITDPRDSRCRGVGGGGQGNADFIFGDVVKVAGGEGGRVVRLAQGDGCRCKGKELCT